MVEIIHNQDTGIVLVANGLDADAVHKGKSKWSSVAALGSNAYAAPHWCYAYANLPPKAYAALHSSLKGNIRLLVVCTFSLGAGGLDTKHTGGWSGIAALGTKAYAAPYHALKLLMVETSGCGRPRH